METSIDSNSNSFTPLFRLEDAIKAQPYYEHLYGTNSPTIDKIFKEMQSQGKRISSPEDPIVKKKFKDEQDRSSNEFKKRVLKKFDSIKRLYENALTGGHFEGAPPESRGLFILGSDFLRDKWMAKHELGNFQVLSSRDNSKGAILNEQSFWNLLANDAVTLGTIRGQKEVWISTLISSPEGNTAISMIDSQGKPTIDDNVLWDAENQRLRVLGREIAQLKASGYELQTIVPRDLGFCLRCRKDKIMEARQMTLEKLCDAAEKTTLEEIKIFLQIE